MTVSSNGVDFDNYDKSKYSDKSAQNDAYFDTIWSDDMYLHSIEQYKDNPELYDYLLKNNPHLRSKNARFVTDPLTGMFNYQGAAAEYYGNMRSDSNAWVEKMVDTWRQQDYDSPVQQAQRESAAGLNPDLLGNVSPGAAAENDNLAPASYHNGGSGSAMEIAQTGLNFIQGVLSFGSQIQQLNLGAASLIEQDLANNQTAMDFGSNIIAGLGSLKKQVVDNTDLLNDPSFPNLLKESVKDAFPSFSRGFNRSTRKLMRSWFDRLEQGDPMVIESARARLRKQILEDNEVSANIKSSPWYSDDFDTWVSNIGSHYSNHIAKILEWDARYRAVLAEAEGQAAEGNVDTIDENGKSVSKSFKSYYGNVICDELLARGKNAEAAKAYSDYMKLQNELWDDILSQCTPAAGQSRRWYHTIGQILVMLFRTQLSQPLHLGFSSSVSDNGRGGHSSMFGLHF